MLFVREKRKGRKSAQSLNCVFLCSRLLRYLRTIVFFDLYPKALDSCLRRFDINLIRVYLRSSVDNSIIRIALQV